MDRHLVLLFILLTLMGCGDNIHPPVPADAAVDTQVDAAKPTPDASCWRTDDDHDREVDEGCGEN
jgi:hypothetical protein